MVLSKTVEDPGASWGPRCTDRRVETPWLRTVLASMIDCRPRRDIHVVLRDCNAIELATVGLHDAGGDISGKNSLFLLDFAGHRDLGFLDSGTLPELGRPTTSLLVSREDSPS